MPRGQILNHFEVWNKPFSLMFNLSKSDNNKSINKGSKYVIPLYFYLSLPRQIPSYHRTILIWTREKLE